MPNISAIIAQLVILQYKYEYKYDSVLHVVEKNGFARALAFYIITEKNTEFSLILL